MPDQQLYEKIIDNLYDGLYFVDRNRVITYWNKGAERQSGFASEEVVGRTCFDNILTHVDGEGRALCFGMCPLAMTIEDGEFRETEVYMHHKDGHRVPVSVRVSPLTNDAGEIIGGVEIFTDISNQEANELRVRELEKLALLDNLTQLANRAFIEREMQGRFEEMARYQVPFGILFMDIDFFKRVNDAHGHAVGDRVLQAVAGTLTANARPFDLFGRWGGEEFIGIIRNVSDEALFKIAERFRFLVESAYVLEEGKRLSVTISIGATIVQAGDTLESLVERADQLLYQSKAAGKNRVTYG